MDNKNKKLFERTSLNLYQEKFGSFGYRFGNYQNCRFLIYFARENIVSSKEVKLAFRCNFNKIFVWFTVSNIEAGVYVPIQNFRKNRMSRKEKNYFNSDYCPTWND